MDHWETTLLAQQQATSDALRAEEEHELRETLLRWWQGIKKILDEGV